MKRLIQITMLTQKPLFLILFIIIATSIAAIGGALIGLDQQILSIWNSEDHVIEVLSALLYFIAAGFAALCFARTKEKIYALSTGAFLFAFAREMDWHKAFTSDSFLKSRFYSSDEIPLNEKIFGASVILCMLCVFIPLLLKIPRLISDFFKLQPTAWFLSGGLGFIAFAKMLDALGRLFPVLVDFKHDNDTALGFLEESLELLGAVLIASAIIIQCAKIYRNRAERGA